ncbi:two pore domain potassium channel family protein [Edwardsiella tarda]|uniref:ion channel n=1 Tax=Edwardsiella tarda TaxID=636 RepID=UPI000D5089C9|nr:ion channel [Edwardsiella tarda]UCQ55670.1 two pore domain potassium channel family protein [Edwardsiella tarda]
MKIKNKATVAYSLIILFFTAVYYLAWSVYPDSFIKNNALNSTPIYDATKLAFSYNDEAHEDYDNISSDDFSKETLKAKKELGRITSKNDELENIVSQQEAKLKSINENLSKAWEKNTQAYVDEASLKHRNELKVKESELKAILSQKNEIQESQFNIMLNDKNIEISKIKLRIAISERDALEYILSHAGEFHDPMLVSELNDTNKIIDDAKAELTINDEEKIKIKNNIQVLLSKHPKEDLNICDFFFYSIGISTTTTFGDLVANSRLIRMLVCIQLLLSILVLANVTQSFLSKK